MDQKDKNKIIELVEKLKTGNVDFGKHLLNTISLLEVLKYAIDYFEQNTELSKLFVDKVQKDIEEKQNAVTGILHDKQEIIEKSNIFNDLVSDFNKEKKELQLKKDDLELKKAKVQTLEQLKLDIKTLNDSLDGVDINAQEQEMYRDLLKPLGVLDKIGQELQEIKNNKQKDVNALRIELKSVVDKVKELDTNIKSTQEALAENEERYKVTKLQFEKLQNNALDLVDKLKSLDTELENIRKTHSNNMNVYKIHFEANKEIWGNINERNKVDTYVEKLSEKLSGLLNEFDEKIKDLVEQREKIKLDERI